MSTNDLGVETLAAADAISDQVNAALDPTPTLLPSDLESSRRTLGVRAPLPDAVKGRIEIEAHPRRGSCLILSYHRDDEKALIDTLQRTLDAIKAGPDPR